jgi:hypothetical protein
MTVIVNACTLLSLPSLTRSSIGTWPALDGVPLRTAVRELTPVRVSHVAEMGAVKASVSPASASVAAME